MSLGIASKSTGTPTAATDLKVGQRILVGVDTKQVLATKRLDSGKVRVKVQFAYAKTGYYTFQPDRTLFVY